MAEREAGERVIKDEQPRVYFNCSKCPAYCCSIYERVKVTKRDITRLAKHFGVSAEIARRRYTHDHDGERVLNRVKDAIFPETCAFLDQRTRGCTVYLARPGVCRGYPGRSRCAYYDVLQFERRQQDDENVVPVVTITFRPVHEEEHSDADSTETIEVWGEEDRTADAVKDPAPILEARTRAAEAGEDPASPPRPRGRRKRP